MLEGNIDIVKSQYAIFYNDILVGIHGVSDVDIKTSKHHNIMISRHQGIIKTSEPPGFTRGSKVCTKVGKKAFIKVQKKIQ